MSCMSIAPQPNPEASHVTWYGAAVLGNASTGAELKHLFFPLNACFKDAFVSKSEVNHVMSKSFAAGILPQCTDRFVPCTGNLWLARTYINLRSSTTNEKNWCLQFCHQKSFSMCLANDQKLDSPWIAPQRHIKSQWLKAANCIWVARIFLDWKLQTLHDAYRKCARASCYASGFAICPASLEKQCMLRLCLVLAFCTSNNGLLYLLA